MMKARVALGFLLAGMLLMSVALVSCSRTLEGTYVLVEGEDWTMVDEVTFSRDGHVKVKIGLFGLVEGATPGFPYEVRGSTIYVQVEGTRAALFEIVDANTLKSDVIGYAGVYKKRAGK